MNPLWMAALALCVISAVFGCWLGWQLLRQNGRMLLRLDGLEKRLDSMEFGEPSGPASLPLDSAAPDFDLPDLKGTHQSLAQFRGQPLLLIFFNPACGFCRELAPKMTALASRAGTLSQAAGQERSEGRPFLLIISTGDAEQNRQLFAEHRLDCVVLLQRQTEVATAYRANGTPSGYLISPEGKIASELAIGGEALLALLADQLKIENQKSKIDQTSALAAHEESRNNRFRNHSLAGSRLKRDGLKAGILAPDFRLPRLDGRGELSLEDFRGRRVLLVFSSPRCGPCHTLAPQLEKFHRAQQEDERSHAGTPAGNGQSSSAVQVLMISKGEPKENRAKVREQGLTFPVVLQQQWEISRRYAMFATPAAYLIDSNGIIEQDVAAGTPAIEALLDRLQAPTALQPAAITG